MRGTSLSRLLLSFAVVVGLAAAGVPAASAALPDRIPDRITSAVSDNSPVAIPGSVHPRVLQATDLGPVPGDTRLTGMSLRFTPSAAQQAALDQLLASLQDPSSPIYRQWLTPQQYAAQFGLSSADLAKVTAWLTSQGFTVTGVAQGGSFVTFDGTVAQAQTAFSTSIHSLSVNGETHFANVTNLSVPSAFSGVVGAVTGLHDFRLKPHLHTSVVHPLFTSDQTGNHFLAPGDVATIYDTQPLLSAGTNGSGIGTGANCHSVPPAGSPPGTPQPTCGDIAVMGQVDLDLTAGVPTDVSAFRSAAGLSTSNLPTTVHEGGDPGAAHDCTPTPTNNCQTPNLLDLDESSVDVEWSGAMAPSASILFVNGPDIFDNSMTQAIDQDLAPIITISYGDCEAAWGSSFMNSFNQLFKEANAQGQTILAAAGDNGATDCEAPSSTSAIEGLAIDFPASSPYVTAMGGTMFNGDAEATGVAPVFSTTQYWTGTSGSDVISSARSYIPEAAWNDASYDGFGGGGGGASAFFAKPAWQVETGASGMTTQVSPDGARDVPDLALNASDAHDPYIFCVQNTCVSGFRQSNGDLNVSGGTSFDSQVFGGMLALIEQKIGAKLGNINPTLYALGNNAAYYNTTSSSVFHDVTTGSNAMPCTEGSTECLYGGTIGYSAGAGYDLATGWGSVDLNNLASAWSWAEAHPEGLGSLGPNLSTTALAASSTTSSATNVTAGTTVTLTATVSGFNLNLVAPPNFSINPTPSSTTPTGTVQFLINNVALGSPVALVAGVASAPFLTTCSAIGSQNVTAVYSGDSNYQGSIGPALTINGANSTQSGAIETDPLIITVNSGSTCPNFSVTAPASTVTVASGGAIPAATITVAPLNGFTGTVVFSATAISSSGYLPTFSFSPASITFNSSNNTSSQTTSLTLAGITASLRRPSLPAQFDSGTMLAQQAPGRTPSPNRPWNVAGSGVTLACLLLLVLPRRRCLGGLLLLAFAVALVVAANGCGGSSQAGPPTTTTSTNPYAGTYIVTVTGTYTGSPALPPQSTTVTYVIN